MKPPLISLVSLSLLVACGQAEKRVEDAPAKAEVATYVNEAALPKDWPMPGPYNEVVEKNYPVYRAAETEKGGQTRSFWTLFSHIKSNDIPMTAPVEMKMEEGEGGEMEMTAMGFLYQDNTVGEVGQSGRNVVVKDVPAMTVLSYAWMGPKTDETIAQAQTLLEAKASALKITIEGFRLLGYNGPSVPKAKRTHELQAIFKKK